MVTYIIHLLGCSIESKQKKISEINDYNKCTRGNMEW